MVSLMSEGDRVLKLSERYLKVFVPLVSDVLDDEYGGLRTNFLMSADIKPVFPDGKVAGMALPVRGATTWKPPNQLGLDELRRATWVRTLEGVRPGNVIVYDTGGCDDVAVWGELISNASAARRGHGAVVDGAVRDVIRLSWMKPRFEVFAKSVTARDSKGRFEILEYNVPVKCGGVYVEPGDFVFGDSDGVVIIPKKIAEEVLVKAEERMAKEDKVRAAFRNGEPIGDVAYRYGVA